MIVVPSLIGCTGTARHGHVNRKGTSIFRTLSSSIAGRADVSLPSRVDQPSAHPHVGKAGRCGRVDPRPTSGRRRLTARAIGSSRGIRSSRNTPRSSREPQKEFWWSEEDFWRELQESVGPWVIHVDMAHGGGWMFVRNPANHGSLGGGGRGGCTGVGFGWVDLGRAGCRMSISASFGSVVMNDVDNSLQGSLWTGGSGRSG